MTLNPNTLLEETDEEKKDRQWRTGVIGNGTQVWCQPYPLDPSVGQSQHRAVCLTRPYPACSTCPHSTFTAVFNSTPQDPYDLIACPRWRGGERDRMDGKAPDSYVPVERVLCSQRPFLFCPSCPSSEVLVDIGADKVRAGWYGRWRRFTHEEDRDG